jgi:hypothetical protein
MQSQVKNLLFWVGAVLLVVAATIFYQPAAAKTGSLLVWSNIRIYVMDIDTLLLDRIGPVGDDEVMAPSPGCSGQIEAPCWVVAGQRLYQISAAQKGPTQERILPLNEGFQWLNTPVVWSPDGQHLAYRLLDKSRNEAVLHIYDVSSNQIKLTVPGVDSAVGVAWTAACVTGLEGVGCQLAYKTAADTPLEVIALTPATGTEQSWQVPTEKIFELHWTTANALLYSESPRHFHKVEDGSPAYRMPASGQLANISPDGKYTVYYQPFTLEDCQDETTCLNLGVWISNNENEDQKPHLIYNFNLAQAETSGLNFIPIWSSTSEAAVFFQNGRLIYYDVDQEEAKIWYKPVRGKLRSAPIFSPNEEAVAFVDNQGQGYSEYRLVVVNPKLQLVEHIIETDTGFRLLAWLPW